MLCDGRYLPGGGSVESHIVNEIEKYANGLKNLSQYGAFKFGQAFEVFGKILLDNAGLNSNRVLPDLLKNNREGCN